MLLTLFKAKSSPFILAPSILFRAVFIAFSLLLLFIVFYYGGISIVGSLMLLVSLFGSFYQESWRVDPKNQEVVFRTGLIFVNKKYVYAFGDIKEVHVEQFVKGILPKSDKPSRFGRHYCQLLISLKNGTEVPVETLPKRSKSKLDAWASDLNSLVLNKK